MNTRELKNILAKIHLVNKDLTICKKHHAEQLAELIAFAKKNTDFYAQVKGDKLSDFPVLTKQDILAKYNKFKVKKECIPFQEGEIHVQETSGSTGTPFQVYQDTRCRQWRIASLKYGNDLINFTEGAPFAQIRALGYYFDVKSMITHNAETNITYIDNSDLCEKNMKKIIDEFNDRKVELVRSYMTSIDLITAYASEKGIELTSHPTFISSGEMMQETLRTRIVDTLKCNIISQYCNEENGVIAQTNLNMPSTTMTLNLATMIVEILKLDSDEPAEEGELGRIVITDLFNYAFPMIRYDLGDTAKIGEIRDGIITKISDLGGRKTDFIRKTNGERIHLWNCMPLIIYHNLMIKQWQFIQESATEYTLNLIPAEPLSPDFIKEAESEFKKLLGQDAIITIVIKDEIPILTSGKRKAIISKI